MADPVPPLSTWTDRELDDRHEAIRQRYPQGITPQQWRWEVLSSVRADGLVHLHAVGDGFDTQSLLMGMAIDGLVRQRDGLKGGPWLITDAGRAYVESAKEIVHG